MRVCKEASKLNRLKHGAFSAGLKASKKALASNRAQVIYIAKDAEAHIIGEISQICKDNGIETVMADTMKGLGDACGIQVGAAVAVLYC